MSAVSQETKLQSFAQERTMSLRGLDVNLGSLGQYGLWGRHTTAHLWGSGQWRLSSQMCAHAWHFHGNYLPEWKANRADPGVSLEFIFRMVALYHHTSKPDRSVQTPIQQWPTLPLWGAEIFGAEWMRLRVDKVLWPEKLMVDNSFDWLHHLRKKMRRMTETNYQ